MQEHHAERQEERGLKNFDHQTRDQTIALHDREMKVPSPPWQKLTIRDPSGVSV